MLPLKIVITIIAILIHYYSTGSFVVLGVPYFRGVVSQCPLRPLTQEKPILISKAPIAWRCENLEKVRKCELRRSSFAVRDVHPDFMENLSLTILHLKQS